MGVGVKEMLLSMYRHCDINKNNSAFFMHFCIVAKLMKRKPFFWWIEYISGFLYSYVISYKLHGFSFFPKVVFDGVVFPVNINKHRSAKIESGSHFSFVFRDFIGDRNRVAINLSANSFLTVSKTFFIGNGVKIVLSPGSILEICGSLKYESGITCNSLILVSKKVKIGFDSILSWGCYISDSSQHKVNGRLKVEIIDVGDNVWISEGVSVAAGGSIGHGSIVGAKSFVAKRYPPYSLLGGVPAKVIKNDVHWER